MGIKIKIFGVEGYVRIIAKFIVIATGKAGNIRL